MRKLFAAIQLVAVLALSFPMTCAGAVNWFQVIARKRAAGGATPFTGVLAERFEAAGYDESGWTEPAGTPNEDYTTSPAPLAGTKSLFIDTGADTENALSRTLTADDECWGYFRITFTAVEAANRDFFRVENGGSALLILRRESGGTIRVAHGTATASTVTTAAQDTEYHIFWRYKKSTGGNGEAYVSISTDGTRQTTGNGYASVTTGSSTSDMDSIRIGFTAAAASDFVIDNIFVDANTDVGDNPT